jgi:hypothetical protein
MRSRFDNGVSKQLLDKATFFILIASS